MMKFKLFVTLLILVFCCEVGYSQKNYKVSLDESVSDKFSTPIITPKSKGMILSFLGAQNLDVIALNKKFKTTNTSSYELPSTGYTILNTQEEDGQVSFLMKKKKDSLNLLQWNQETSNWTLGENLFNDDELFLFSSTYRQKIITFHLKVDSAKIYVYQLNGLGRELMGSYDVGEFKLGERDFSTLVQSQKGKISLIDASSPNELYATKKTTKAYQFDSQVYISIDDSLTATTGVIYMDLESKTHKAHYLTAKDRSCPKKSSIKSAISENYMVQVKSCKSSGTIIFRDLKDFSVIKTESIVNEDGILGSACYENLINTDKKALSIEKIKSKSLLQQLSSPKGSIYMSESKGGLMVLMGSTVDNKRNKIEKQRARKNQNKGKGSGGGNGGGKGGGKGKKVEDIQRYDMNKKLLGLSKSLDKYESLKPKYAAFYFDTNLNQFVPDADFENVFEDIVNHKFSLNQKSVAAQSLFTLKGDYWYGYRDLATNKYVFGKVSGKRKK